MDAITNRRHRLAIYGGTFAPPHIGHVHAVQAFLKQVQPDTLLIMPAAIPPHKQIDADDDPRMRLAMAEAAFASLDSRVRVSDYEISRGGASYTWQTLTHFRRTTDSDLIFLCGTDMFLTLDMWRSPEIIFELAQIACVMRVGDEESYRKVHAKAAEYAARFGARTVLVESMPLELSSSEIRVRVKAGEDIASLVPRDVESFIRTHGLYQK